MRISALSRSLTRDCSIRRAPRLGPRFFGGGYTHSSPRATHAGQGVVPSPSHLALRLWQNSHATERFRSERSCTDSAGVEACLRDGIGTGRAPGQGKLRQRRRERGVAGRSGADQAEGALEALACTPELDRSSLVGGGTAAGRVCRRSVRQAARV
uniref:Uncharacterized protein n=1 Tax=Cafeteria roenbergensis TaxID=33653 RepID=A0A7S0JUT3_CAFRO